MIQGIHHFAVISSSGESVRFYQRLGFAVSKRIKRSSDTVVLLEGHRIGIEMFIDPSHPPRPAPEPLGFRHIALRVDKIEETVQAIGLTSGPVMTDWTGVRFVFLTDPDGNTIELHE